MTKKDDKKNFSYDIERVRMPMSRKELDALYNEYKSDDN